MKNFIFQKIEFFFIIIEKKKNEIFTYLNFFYFYFDQNAKIIVQNAMKNINIAKYVKKILF
jgi:hypothetical protein